MSNNVFVTSTFKGMFKSISFCMTSLHEMSPREPITFGISLHKNAYMHIVVLISMCVFPIGL